MAGGGGGSQTTEAGLPDWVQPYAKEGLEGAVGDYRAGRYGHVEGLSDPQADAFGRQLELGQRGGVLDRLAQESHESLPLRTLHLLYLFGFSNLHFLP